MFRAHPVVLILVVLAAAVAFFMGYRLGDHGVDRPSERAVGTTGTSPTIDTSRARKRAPRLAKRSRREPTRPSARWRPARSPPRSRQRWPSMIRSRRSISTSIRMAPVVTLTGTVDSAAERARAVQLARETAGVTSVTDHITVR